MTETPYGLYGRQNPKIPTSPPWFPVLIPRTVAIEAVWPALQFNISLCPILFLSPPFHRFWATGNALVCFLENTTYITEVDHQNSLIFKALGWASSNPIILGFLRPYYSCYLQISDKSLAIYHNVVIFLWMAFFFFFSNGLLPWLDFLLRKDSVSWCNWHCNALNLAQLRWELGLFEEKVPAGKRL